jgi:Antitoxin MazE-like
MRNQLIKRRGFARSKRRAISPIRLHRRPRRAYDKIAEGLLEVLEMVRRPGFAEEARRQGDLVAATYKDDEEIALWLDNAETEWPDP